MLKHRLLLAASAAALASASITGVANAQAVAAPAAAPVGESDLAVQELVVTGSRVARVGFQAPTPVTALATGQLRDANPGNLNEALRQLPILSASTGPRGATGSAGNGGSFLNLRRLGGPRTLTLLDGRRFVPTNSQGTVDTAMFPQALIERVEIVTGGASAAYGSDAVAGVVNFILDRDFEGVKGEAMYGISTESDMPEQKLALAAGKSFAGGRGHVLISGEYFNNQGLYDLLQRDVYQRSCLPIINPAGPTGRTFACDVRNSNANFAGLISAGPLRGTTFDQASNAIPFNFGALTSNATQVGGDGPLQQFLPLAVPIERYSFFTRGSWELTDSISAFAEASYGGAVYEYQIGSYSQTIGNTALTIFRDNAYLTPEFRQRMVTANVQNFRLGRYSRDLPRTWITHQNYTTRFVGGFEGKTLGFDWNTYYQYGKNHRSIRAEYDLHLDRYQEASDAVLAANGQIVCRSTLANPGNGCAPINVLGEHQPSAAALDYVTDTNWTYGHSTQQVAEFNVSRDVFTLPAGPVSLAAGVGWRRETVKMTADPRSYQFSVISNARGPYRVGNYIDQSGEVSVREGYAETVVPLIRDVPLIRELEFNGAVRRTDYSTSGGVTTWKAGVTWRPHEIIRFRGTRSRDIRAPNLEELFNSGTVNRSPTFLDQFYDPPRTLNAVLNIQQGNPDLDPEIANTLTFGAVITPSFLPNLDISIDAYDIEINGYIASVGGTQSTLDCRNGSQAACDRIIRDAQGNVVTAYQIPINLSRLSAEGVDIEVAYRFRLEDIGSPVPGDVNLRFLGNYVGENYTVAPGARVVDRTGDASQPQWRWMLAANYRRGALGVGTQFRYTGSGPYDSSTTAVDLPQRKIPGQVLVNANISYDFDAWGGRYSAYLNVQNVLDQRVPMFGDGNNFDEIGRYFRAGITFQY
jgi:outer membrane receptor protein involved in Fe transport